MNVAEKLKLMDRELPVADRIPIVGHLTDHIVKTRNGDLVTVLELDGTAFESKTPEQRLLYKDRLNTTFRNAHDSRLVLWSHVVRRRVHPRFTATFDNSFLQKVYDDYAALQRERPLFSNRLFITFLLRPNLAGRGASLFRKKDKAVIEQLTLDAMARLNDLVANALSSFSEYGPRTLGLRLEGDLRFSEVGEFYSLLINHTPHKVPVGPFDLSQAIGDRRISFGSELFSVRHPGTETYGGVLTIKEYPAQTWPEMFTDLLSLPIEFNFAQLFSMLEKGKAKNLFKAQQNRLFSSGDEAKRQVAHIDDALDALISNEFVVGHHNLSFIAFADSKPDAVKALSSAHEVLADPGCVVMREDLALEGHYWSQLPGNLALAPRPAAITSLNYAAFSPFFNYPGGRRTGHHWGDAACLFRTSVDSPYWFAPHLDDLGNLALIGMTGSGKTVLMGFLLAMLQQTPGIRQVFIDKDEGAKVAIHALGGRYFPLKAGTPTGFNPFARPLDQKHAIFLFDLIKLIVGEPFAAADAKALESAIRSVYTSVQTQNRRLSALLPFLDNTDPNGIAARLRDWVSGGRHAWVFDNPTDELTFETLTGFDTTEFLDMPSVRTGILSYLFYRINPLLDGQPFALWIDEFWKALDDDYFRRTIKDKLKVIRKQNGILVSATQSPADALQSEISAAILEQTPTKLFLPNEYANERDYKDGFKLTEAEWPMLRDLIRSDRKFLLKRPSGSALCDFDIGSMDEVLTVLSGTTANNAIFDALCTEHGGTLPPNWVPHFLRRVMEVKS